MWKKTPVVVEAWLSALRVGALACLRVQGQVIGVALSGTASLLKVDTSCMEDGRKCRAQLDRSRESYFNPPKSKKPCLEVLWILVGRRLTRWENTDSPDQDISLLLQKEMLMYEQESPITCSTKSPHVVENFGLWEIPSRRPDGKEISFHPRILSALWTRLFLCWEYSK